MAVFIFLVLFSVQAIAAGDSESPKTPAANVGNKESLVEMFLGISDKLLPLYGESGKVHSREARKKMIEEHDAKNGYLKLKPGSAEALEEGAVVLFRKRDKSPLVAISLKQGDVTNHILFFERKMNHWADVTKEVMPAITDETINKRAQEKIPDFKKNNRKLTDSASGTFAYVLPRHGTTIDIIVMSDAYSGPRLVLGQLVFNGERFILAELKAAKKT